MIGKRTGIGAIALCVASIWLAPAEAEPVLAAYELATGDSQRRLGRLYEGLVGIDPEDAIAWRDD